MKARALEAQQERERHAKDDDVEVDDDEEQKKSKSRDGRRRDTSSTLQQLTDREHQQKSVENGKSEEKVRVVWDGENVQVETVKTPIASDAVR